MFFNSIQYIFFLPLVVILFYLTPQRFRWILLLAASYYFYMCWKAEYIILILISTAIDYFAGLQISKSGSNSTKTACLIISLFANLGILFAFKYFNFFSESVGAILNKFNLFVDVPLFQALLPVGISFYTFQSMSYTIDIYRGKKAAESHFGYFALYVSFFPQLVAGPIERSNRLLPQFRQQTIVSPENIVSGFRFILWGFFQKIVVADRLAAYVNPIYNHPENFSGNALAFATVLFSFQIYCDFCGYSNVAIGSAKLLGIDLMHNFRTPYFSSSISDFWSRWHISLSSWFKDYLYIPLGGNRKGGGRWLLNVFGVFTLSGLWHGANMTFVYWGLLHWVYFLLHKVISRLMPKTWEGWLWNGAGVLFTYAAVSFAWIFFRANSLADAFTIIGAFGAISLRDPDLAHGLSRVDIIIAMYSLLALILIDLFFLRKPGMDPFHKGLLRHRLYRWGGYYGLSSQVIFLGYTSNTLEFIYFQF